jgi:hypothetical protein
MAVSEQISRLIPYAQRLLDDDYVQDEFDRLFTSVRNGCRRAQGKSVAQAAGDAKLRNQLAAAVAAATHIARALNEPIPTSPKRHWARSLTLVLAAGGVALIGYRQLTARGSVQRDG